MADEMSTLLKDTDLDTRMEAIKSLVSARLKNLIGESDVPAELDYVVTEVSIARFNQIGSEGASSYSVAGESMTWTDDIFAPYMDDIQAYLNRKTGLTGKYKVKFL